MVNRKKLFQAALAAGQGSLPPPVLIREENSFEKRFK